MNLSQILIRPVLTEKSVHQERSGKYTFVVRQDASKVDIEKALETLYGVHAENVNMLHTSPKLRMGKGRKMVEKRSSAHRAIVTLKKGEKLEITKLKTSSKPNKKTAAAK